MLEGCAKRRDVVVAQFSNFLLPPQDTLQGYRKVSRNEPRKREIAELRRRQGGQGVKGRIIERAGYEDAANAFTRLADVDSDADAPGQGTRLRNAVECLECLVTPTRRSEHPIERTGGVRGPVSILGVFRFSFQGP